MQTSGCRGVGQQGPPAQPAGRERSWRCCAPARALLRLGPHAEEGGGGSRSESLQQLTAIHRCSLPCAVQVSEARLHFTLCEIRRSPGPRGLPPEPAVRSEYPSLTVGGRSLDRGVGCALAHIGFVKSGKEYRSVGRDADLSRGEAAMGRAAKFGGRRSSRRP
jgi:hypothetical protein